MKVITKLILLVLIACLCSIYIYYNSEKYKPLETVKDVLTYQEELEGDIFDDSKYTIDNPKVILNPYQISPLTALIIFETNDLTTPTVTIKGKDNQTTITHTFTPNKKHILPIYGLYPNYNNEITIKINKTVKKINIKTDKLPTDFIIPTQVKTTKSYLNNDLYFTTPSSSGYTAAYDINGDVRWYLTDKFVWDINRLRNGNLLLSSNRLINPPYYMTGLVEMDLLGKVYFEYDLPGGYHHDAFEMENGDLLVASNNFDHKTVEDYVVLIDRNTGEITKKIDLSKIIDPDTGKSANSVSYDWFHNNSIWYDKKTNSITLSGRHQDAIINIDFETDELNWIIGDSTNWDSKYKKYFFKPMQDDFEWQYAQHAAMILPNGNVFLFDNGNNRSKVVDEYVDPNNNYSRAVIYEIDTDEMTIKQVWQYGKERGSSYYSPYISDVDYLDSNHYLINSGGHVEVDGKVSNNPAALTDNPTLTTYITEILNDNVIFELILPTNTYRVEKLKLYDNNLYIPGPGKRVGDMGKTKVDKTNAFILFNKKINADYLKYNIQITKEVDRLSISGLFNKKDKVEIILDSLFNKKIYKVIVSDKPYTAMCIDLFNQDNINVTKYINDIGLKGKYDIYIRINGTIYNTYKYVTY